MSPILTQVAAAFASVKAAFGRLDLLFNNAGMAARSVPMEELSFAEWKAVVDVNLTGAFLCTQQAMKLMKTQRPQGGRIINNGSVATHAPRPNSAPYTASKHAITGLTKSTSLDGRAFDIACGQIDIGNAATELLRPLVQAGTQGGPSAEPMIDVGLVGAAIVQMASLPLEANIQFMTLMATKMPSDRPWLIKPGLGRSLSPPRLCCGRVTPDPEKRGIFLRIDRAPKTMAGSVIMIQRCRTYFRGEDCRRRAGCKCCR